MTQEEKLIKLVSFSPTLKYSLKENGLKRFVEQIKKADKDKQKKLFDLLIEEKIEFEEMSIVGDRLLNFYSGILDEGSEHLKKSLMKIDEISDSDDEIISVEDLLKQLH